MVLFGTGCQAGQGYTSVLWRTGNVLKTFEKEERHQPCDILVKEGDEEDTDILERATCALWARANNIGHEARPTEKKGGVSGAFLHGFVFVVFYFYYLLQAVSSSSYSPQVKEQETAGQSIGIILQHTTEKADLLTHAVLWHNQESTYIFTISQNDSVEHLPKTCSSGPAPRWSHQHRGPEDPWSLRTLWETHHAGSPHHIWQRSLCSDCFLVHLIAHMRPSNLQALRSTLGYFLCSILRNWLETSLVHLICLGRTLKQLHGVFSLLFSWLVPPFKTAWFVPYQCL